MSYARIVCSVALAVTVLVPFSASSAGAARSSLPSVATTTDRTHDVVSRTASTNPLVPIVPTPAHSNGDIATVRVRHTATQVRVVTRFVALDKVGSQHFHVVQLRTPVRRYEADLYATTGSWKGRSTIYTGAGRPVNCKLTWKIDYVANSTLIVIPRSCLGKPRWIQAGSGMSSFDGTRRFSDDGLTARPGTDTLTLGPKLYS